MVTSVWFDFSVSDTHLIMGPKQQIWSQDTEILLIHLVRARPILWDATLTDYRRTDLKEVCWEEIAKQMGSYFTSTIVKKRFINIRDTFFENLRKVKNSKQRASGKGADEIYKPKWPLYDNLLFLQKSCAAVASTSNISTLKQSFPNSSQSPYSTESNIPISELSASQLVLPSNTPVSLYWNETLKAYVLSEENKSVEKNVTEDALLSGDSFDSQNCSIDAQSVESLPSSTLSLPERPASAPNPSTSITPKESLYKKRGAKKMNTQEALELMKQVISEPTVVPQGDAAEYFGSYIAARLREMNSVQRRHCEDEIMKALNSS